MSKLISGLTNSIRTICSVHSRRNTLRSTCNSEHRKTKMTDQANLSYFDQLPMEYKQLWLEFTNKSSMTVQEVENEINQMLISLIFVDKWFEFSQIMYGLKPDQRFLEGLFMICQLANNFIDFRLEVIVEGGFLLQRIENRFAATEKRISQLEWLMLLEREAQLLPLDNQISYVEAPTRYPNTNVLTSMLRLTVDRMNELIQLAQKVARAWRLPEFCQGSEWVTKTLNRDLFYTSSWTSQPISIKQILNQTVAKSMYVKHQCEGLLVQYRKIMMDILHSDPTQPIIPTLSI